MVSTFSSRRVGFEKRRLRSDNGFQGCASQPGSASAVTAAKVTQTGLGGPEIYQAVITQMAFNKDSLRSLQIMPRRPNVRSRKAQTDTGIQE